MLDDKDYNNDMELLEYEVEYCREEIDRLTEDLIQKNRLLTSRLLMIIMLFTFDIVCCYNMYELNNENASLKQQQSQHIEVINNTNE